MQEPRTLAQAADLYGDIEPTPEPQPGRLLPGLVVAALATLAASALASRYGAPLTLMALLVGLALNFLAADKRLSPGLGFAARELLRVAIVLLGVRVTVAQIAELGPGALLAVVLVMAGTLGAGVLAARAFGFSRAFGALGGGAVAICGASAAMALYGVLGEKRVQARELTLVLVAISVLSPLAMVTYPTLAHWLGLSDRAAGLFLGASVHDVAQALGAGFSFSDEAGGTATIVKLSRVALMAPVLALVALAFARDGAGKGKGGGGVPWFVLGFFAVAGLNSAVALPVKATAFAAEAATALLAVSVAATAIRAPLGEVLRGGWRPLLVMGAATLAALLLALGAALALG
jgi:uncharacterized integral membrane protein (TIGR00698 family)